MARFTRDSRSAAGAHNQQPPASHYSRTSQRYASAHRPRKRHNLTLAVAIPLLALGVALMAGAGVTFFQNQEEYQAGVDEYHQLAQANVTEDTVTGRPVVDFDALKQQNPEIVGWIQIPGTPINYPVCQTYNNDHYLVHTFLDQYNLAGTIFMDYRSFSTLSDWNTAVYGHHLQNGEMFARIADYSNQAEFDTITNVYYITQDGEVRVLLPLCCIVVSGYDVDAVQFDFPSQQQFEVYVQSLLDRASARAASASANDLEHIYMLSTCSYANENDRTILVCVDYGAGGNTGTYADATQSMSDIQAAADAAAGIA